MTNSESEDYGFVLVTTNPMVSGGLTASAYNLVMARLERKRWPLYERTRKRDKIAVGSRLAFYIAGKRLHWGDIVATATVAGVNRFRSGSDPVDPKPYLTDHPYIVLDLGQIAFLKPHVSLRDAMPRMSFCPEDLKNWGTVLQGGVRSLSKRDWVELF